jgi:hypothetical protein
MKLSGQGQENLKIELVQLTEEQKLDRAVRNVTCNFLTGIAYAKALGNTPEDFGKFYADLFSFAWDNIKGKGPEAFVQNWYRLLQTDKNSQFKIVNASKNEITAQMSVYGLTTFKALPDLGVTLDEYAIFLATWSGIAANNAGLDYYQKLKGDWIEFKVSVKK